MEEPHECIRSNYNELEKQMGRRAVTQDILVIPTPNSLSQRSNSVH